MKQTNPYVQYCVEKGYTVAETRQAKPVYRSFPCTIGWRYVASEEEYNALMADFLNGN